MPTLGTLHSHGHAGGVYVASTQTVAVDSPSAVAVAYGPMPRQPGTTVAAMTATIYRRSAPGVEVVELDEAWGHRWLDQLNEPGSAEVTVANDDADYAELQTGDLIRFDLFGRACFTMVYRDRHQVTISPDEEVDEATKISGPGVLALLDESLVYPSRPEVLDFPWSVHPVEVDRVFNWASPYLDDSDWGPVNSLAAQADTTIYWTGLPANWPDTAAEWLFGPSGTLEWAPEGWCYHRTSFTTTADVDYAIVYVAADAQAEIWLDGQSILTTEQMTGDPSFIFQVAVVLGPGDHTLGVACWNDPDPEGDQLHNPGGFLLTMYPIDLSGNITSPSPLVRSDYTWVCVDRTLPPGSGGILDPPGISVGRVIRAVVEEAQDRGELAGVTLAFDDDTDSEGVAWPKANDISTKVGTDLLAFVRELTATYCDVWMSPQLELYAWVRDGRGQATDVVLHPPDDPDDPFSGNLAGLEHHSTANPHNVLLCRWAGGWHEVVDAASVATYGRRVALLGLGAVHSIAEVERIAGEQLGIYADPRTAISADHVPVEWSAEDGSTDMPYWDFGVGDSIHVPDIDGVSSVERVVAITVAMDEDGVVTYSPELKDVILGQQERWEQATKKMSDGTMRGDSKVATPTGLVATSSPTCCVKTPPGGG